MNSTRADFLRRRKRRKRGQRRATARERQQAFRKKIAEFLGCAFVGATIGGVFLVAFAFDDYEPPAPPENYGKIEYCGVWWEPEDYEQMMAEREAYLRAEKEKD